MTSYQKYCEIIASWRWVTPAYLKGSYLNGVYGEWHHIHPRSLGGKNESSNLVWLPYLVHYQVHQLLIEFCTGIAKRKMYFALRMFYDKNGVLFTIEQREEMRRAGILALTGNTHTKGQIRLDITERLKKNHPEQTERFKGLTELWYAYDILGELLCVGVSINTESRFFGNNRKYRGTNIGGGDGGNVRYWPWFQFYHHHTIVIYSTRKEAMAAKRLIIKNEKPKYQQEHFSKTGAIGETRRKLAKQRKEKSK